MLVIFKIFLIGFLLNFVYEIFHSQLYTTCHKMKYADRITLLTIMSLKDGFWITLFYVLAAMSTGVTDVFHYPIALALFCGLGLLFSYFDERISISLKRWEYAPSMPRVFGVGVTPLLEIAVTGLVTLYIVFSLFA